MARLSGQGGWGKREEERLLFSEGDESERDPVVPSLSCLRVVRHRLRCRDVICSFFSEA